MGDVRDGITRLLSADLLAPIVRRALGDGHAEVSTFACHPVGGGAEAASSIWRVTGSSKTEAGARPWSVILKVVNSSPALADPQGVRYWEREALAYESGALEALPGGMSAPLCYGTMRRPNGSVWLWLEGVSDAVYSDWPLEYYGVVARHLGRFNGTYAAGGALPTGSWYTRHWLAAYVGQTAPAIAFMRSNRDDPLVKSMYPGLSRSLILAVWDERLRLLALLDRLPQTFCHQDAFRRNLFSQPKGIIAIDWGYAGTAPVGAELVALVGGSVAFGEIPGDKFRELDRLAFDAYLQGLAEVGWHGRRRDVRMSYVLTALLRYVIGGSVGEAFAAMIAGDATPSERADGSLPEEVIHETNQEAEYYQGLLKEALGLLGFPRVLGMLLRSMARAVVPGRSQAPQGPTP